MKSNTYSETVPLPSEHSPIRPFGKRNYFIERADKLRWELPSPVVSGRVPLFITSAMIRLYVMGKLLARGRKAAGIASKNAPMRSQYDESYRIPKMARIAGRYFWQERIPGWPSSAFDRYLTDNASDRETSLQKVFVIDINQCAGTAVGKHISSFNQNLFDQITRLRQNGATQIILKNPEPEHRVDAIADALSRSQPGCDFWMITTGYAITQDDIKKLKKAGLTGLLFQLDHFTIQLSGEFSNLNNAFEWIIKACMHAYEAKLAVGLSLNFVRDTATEENLLRYAVLARKLGAAFIYVQEAANASRTDQLTPAQQRLLEEFCLRLNFDENYRKWPIAVCATLPTSMHVAVKNTQPFVLAVPARAKVAPVLQVG